MLPDPQILKDLLEDGTHAIKCGYRRWRVVRAERKLEKQKLKEINLRIKGWAR